MKNMLNTGKKQLVFSIVIIIGLILLGFWVEKLSHPDSKINLYPHILYTDCKKENFGNLSVPSTHYITKVNCNANGDLVVDRKNFTTGDISRQVYRLMFVERIVTAHTLEYSFLWDTNIGLKVVREK